jgi:uncharacterized protein
VISYKVATDFIPSRFNFHVPTHEGPLLYNAASGAVLALAGADGKELAMLLSGMPERWTAFAPGMDAIPRHVLRDLIHGRFLVGIKTDEVTEVRKRYWAARRETPVVLTITTTMDCNLGCYYCYEKRSPDALSLVDVDTIVALAASRLDHGKRRSLHVDWYGGEPFLNIEFLESASMALQHFCKSRGIKYSSSVISNGTCWPDDVPSFVALHALNQVQISFDGMKTNHNRRRRYRRGYDRGSDSSSFDRAVLPNS